MVFCTLLMKRGYCTLVLWHWPMSGWYVVFQEQEQMQCYNQRMIELLKVRQQQEKNRLPKIQRSEGKTRMVMFKKSLKINSSGNSAEDREKIKQVNRVSVTSRSLTVRVCVSSFLRLLSRVQFTRLEEKRQKTERLHQQQKHENQMREMINQCEGNSRELQQLQVTYTQGTTRPTAYLSCLLCQWAFTRHVEHKRRRCSETFFVQTPILSDTLFFCVCSAEVKIINYKLS